MNIPLNLGTLAVVVLVVTTATCLAVLLCLTVWTRTGTSHPLHCGHCHSLLALRGVIKAPVALPVSSPRLCLVPQHLPSQQVETVAVDGGGVLPRTPVSAELHGHEPHRIIATRDPTISTHSIPGTDSFQVGHSIDIEGKSLRIMSPSYLRKSDSTIVHPKHTMFQRTCSTRKQCPHDYVLVRVYSGLSQAGLISVRCAGQSSVKLVLVREAIMAAVMTTPGQRTWDIHK